MKVIWLGDEDAQTTKVFGLMFEPGVEVDVSSLPESQQKKLQAHPSFAANAIVEPAKPVRRKLSVAQPEPESEPQEPLSDDEN